MNNWNYLFKLNSMDMMHMKQKATCHEGTVQSKREDNAHLNCNHKEKFVCIKPVVPVLVRDNNLKNPSWVLRAIITYYKTEQTYQNGVSFNKSSRDIIIETESRKYNLLPGDKVSGLLLGIDLQDENWKGFVNNSVEEYRKRNTEDDDTSVVIIIDSYHAENSDNPEYCIMKDEIMVRDYLTELGLQGDSFPVYLCEFSNILNPEIKKLDNKTYTSIKEILCALDSFIPTPDSWKYIDKSNNTAHNWSMNNETKRIHMFTDGLTDKADMKCKMSGINFKKLASIGAPIPCGFIINTDVCKDVCESHENNLSYDNLVLPAKVEKEILQGVRNIEVTTNRKLGGDGSFPLLLNVCLDNAADIGEKEIYNIGFSEKTIESILEKNIYNLTEEYLWNMYADFVREYSYFVYEVSYKYFDKYKNIANAKEKCRKWLNIVMELVGKPIPTDPYEQLYEVIAKFYDEWKNNPRAIVFKSKLREADRMLNKHLISLVVYETHYGDIDSNSCIIRLNTYDASKDFCVKNEKFAIGSDHKRQIIPDNICMLCEAVRRRIKEKFIPVTVDIINEGGILYVTKVKPYIGMVADLQDD